MSWPRSQQSQLVVWLGLSPNSGELWRKGDAGTHASTLSAMADAELVHGLGHMLVHSVPHASTLSATC